MKLSIAVCSMLIVAVPLANDGIAAGLKNTDEAVLVSLGENGPTDKQSKRALQHLLWTANSEGFVNVWIVLNTPFFPAAQGILTAEQLAEQSAGVEASFHELLDGLVVGGHVIHAPAGPFIEGPTCAIRVSKAGLKFLARSDRVGQIVEME